jgi:hypothetical protein
MISTVSTIISGIVEMGNKKMTGNMLLYKSHVLSSLDPGLGNVGKIVSNLHCLISPVATGWLGICFTGHSDAENPISWEFSIPRFENALAPL